MRATLADVRRSRFAQVIGVCDSDLPRIAKVVNEATQRLIYAGGETGFWGLWQRVVFNTVSATQPYLTLPRQFARAINMDVCQVPIRINNEFYELLPGGVGLMPTTTIPDWCGSLAGYERSPVPTMVDLATTNQKLRVYLTDVRDVGSRILISGLDQNGIAIYSTDGPLTVNGFYLTLDTPFVTSSFVVSTITGIQKDTTFGDVVLKQVDQVTGAEVLLSRYATDETNPAYRRYFITRLPVGCCAGGAPSPLQITAAVKLEYIPVSRDTDQLILANIPALIEEAQALRYSEMDVPNAAILESKHHKRAIKLLQDEMRHYEGEQRPAVSVDIWNGAPLENQGIGTLI